MKLLLFQVKSFYWKSFSKTLEEVEEQEVEERVSDAVVAFLHAETEDPEKTKLETKILKNIKWLANKRNFKNVVLHSFTHLSESTAPPAYARGLLDRLAERLNTSGYRVRQTPFGYFCAWDLSVHGESLAKVFKSL